MRLVVLFVAFCVMQNSGVIFLFQKKKKDYSINNMLFISDYRSIVRNFGDLYKYKLEDYNDGEVVYMLNKDGSEYLKLIAMPGNYRNAYGEFEVSYNKVKKQLYYRSNLLNFFTESGIRLGMSDSALISIKGKPVRKIRQSDGSVLYEYSFADDVFYFFRAWIKNGAVQKFRFGDENP